MDDLQKDTLQTWNARIRLEKLKMRLRKVEAILATGEYKENYGEVEFKKMEKEVRDLKLEQLILETNTRKLESRIKLPNPYLDDLQ